MEIRALKPIKKLDDNIKELLNKEVDNTELITELNNEYNRKRLNLKIIPCLFDDTKEVEDLTDIEKIAFSDVCYKILKKQDKNWYRDFDVNMYFSDQALMEYETYKNVEEPVNEIYFPIAKKINEYNYRVDLTGKQVYEYMKNMLLLYNKKTQRQGKVKKIGTRNTYTREISLNKKSVEEMKEQIIAETFEESEVILNVRIIQGKTPNFKFTESEYIKNIGEILIIPDYNRDSDNITYVEIIDGFHRLNAIHDAVEQVYTETGKWLDVSIGAKIVLADQERALRIVEQTFKRTDTNKQFLKSIRQDGVAKFVRELVGQSKELKNQMENTVDECMAFKKLTYWAVLIESIEKLDIDTNDIVESAYMTAKIPQKLDQIIGCVKRIVDKDSKYDYMLLPNIFAIYFKIAYLLYKKEDSNILDVESALDKIMCLTDEEVKKLKLDKEKFSINNILNLVDEV